MPNPIPNETAERIRNALSAGRKIDAVRLYCQATGASLADAKAFVDQLETGTVTMSDAAPSVMSSKSLSDFGWDCEPTNGGGVRLCRSAGWRGTRLGCTFGFLVLFSPVALALLFAGKGFWKGPADEGALRMIFLLIPLGFVGLIGLVVTVIVVQILQLALLREEWLVSENLLEVRRRLLGFAWSRQLRHGELVVEPQYGADRHEPDWDLVVQSDGEKHFLIREWLIGVGGGRMSGSASRDEATAVADALAQHTGWNVISVAAETGPTVAGDEEQHLAALRARGFVADVDEQLRLTIRPPKLGQLIAGVVLLAIGGGWLCLMADAVNSFVNDAQAKQQPILDIWFWLIMTPMLMAGVGLCTLGVVSLFGRERWTVDRNLLLVRSRIFGWRSEHEFVDARWKLTRVRQATSKSTTWTWQLQLENQSGRTLKVLRMDRDDDLPRLLGTLLSQRTGWPLCDSVQESAIRASNGAEGASLIEEPPPGNRIQCRLTGKKLALSIAPCSRMSGTYLGCFPVCFLGFAVLSTLFVGIGFYSSEIKEGDGWGMILFLSLVWIIVVCVWLPGRFGKTHVLIEPGRLVTRYELFGWLRTREYVLDKDLDWVSLVADFSTGKGRSRTPVYHVHVSTAGRPAKFGIYLSIEEKEWLVARINQHLGHGSKGVQRGHFGSIAGRGE